jgi:hypothetical protein
MNQPLILRAKSILVTQTLNRHNLHRWLCKACALCSCQNFERFPLLQGMIDPSLLNIKLRLRKLKSNCQSYLKPKLSRRLYFPQKSKKERLKQSKLHQTIASNCLRGKNRASRSSNQGPRMKSHNRRDRQK